MPGGPRARHWAFTLNNYTTADLDRLSNNIQGVDYLLFGKEIASTGTPHLQGHISFSTRKRLTQVKDVVGRAHVSIVRDLASNIEYCKKEGDFIEFGTSPVRDTEGTTVPTTQPRQSREAELEAFKTSVKNGVTDMKELRELHSVVCAFHGKFVEQYVEDHAPRHEVTPHPLREWQQELYSKLILPPDPREITFIIDADGNQGKTWFARYYCDLHSNAQIIIPGKKADMAYVVRSNVKVFFFDCPRSKQGEFIQYDFLEELKNGLIISPKYESRMKKMATPHVVVMMNEHPDMTKLSMDRYSVKVLN